MGYSNAHIRYTYMVICVCVYNCERNIQTRTFLLRAKGVFACCTRAYVRTHTDTHTRAMMMMIIIINQRTCARTKSRAFYNVRDMNLNVFTKVSASIVYTCIHIYTTSICAYIYIRSCIYAANSVSSLLCSNCLRCSARSIAPR